MEIVKKNILSIVCGVIVLLALIVAYFPVGGWFAQLQETLTARATVEQQLERLDKKQRVLPVLSPNEAPVKLTHFPNQPTINAVDDSIRQLLVNEAQSLRDDALEYNQDHHVRLTEEALPNPSDPAKFDFQKADAAALVNLRDNVLVGCMPPNDAEIKKGLEDLRAEKDKLLMRQGGVVVNQAAVDADYKKEADLLPARMRLQAALTHKTYVFPTALKTPDVIANTAQFPRPDEIWYAQVGYWIDQDVCNAIALTNKESHTVLDSPVKALTHLDPAMTSALYVLQPVENTGGRPAPPPPSNPDGPLTTNFNLSATGRVCNPLYDVVQFDLGVNVDARYTEVFLRNLCKDQFITVRQLNMTKLDLDEENAGMNRGGGMNNGPAGGFIYGNNAPVAHLDLQCEELFLRRWTVPWMPDDTIGADGKVLHGIKHDLGIPPSNGATPGNQR